MEPTKRNTVFFIFPCGAVIKRYGSIRGMRVNGSRPYWAVFHKELDPYRQGRLHMILHPVHGKALQIPDEFEPLMDKFIQRIRY